MANYCIDCDKEIDRKAIRCASCAASNRNRGKSGSLNNNWKGGKVHRRCAICGAEFHVKPSRLKTGRGVYCSVKCRRIAQAEAISGENHPRWVGKVAVVCEWCGNEFMAYQLQIDIGKRFCSNTCHGAWITENLSGENSPVWRGRLLTQECLSCGKEFQVYAGIVENGLGKFCSRDCYGAYYSGPRRPQWQGGISFAPYPPTFNDEFRRMIRKRDGYKCVLCGKTRAENGRRLSVHHVDYNKECRDPDLFVTLCHSCHSKTNNNRDFWQVVFTKYRGRKPKMDWQRKAVLTAIMQARLFTTLPIYET